MRIVHCSIQNPKKRAARKNMKDKISNVKYQEQGGDQFYTWRCPFDWGTPARWTITHNHSITLIIIKAPLHNSLDLPSMSSIIHPPFLQVLHVLHHVTIISERTIIITVTISPPCHGVDGDNNQYNLTSNALHKHFNNCGDQSTSATITINEYDQVHWHWVPYSDGGCAKDSCSSASCAQQVALKEKKKTQFLDRSSLRPQICSLSSTPQCRNSHSGSLFTDGCSTATLKSYKCMGLDGRDPTPRAPCGA